ncbi:fibronectin type III domain-containing protein [Arenibacter sp. ARW7G5Y1]|uniref:fibronectin type III domain-containing protein n=1 Tax=Arenibacter sp. ARW7G5Y1 TaxID=2135619 RepID=UPI000D7729CB|nr:fibronectin type III domain-containing protein [Arenibacter sp. ARW7G5Y1]PXX28383.1 chitodextrinase [Arenibacter sp. ARW7G5Y1]
MESKKLLFLLLFFLSVGLVAQDLHTQANAVSVANESNSTAGWSGQATLTVDGTDTQSGNFSFVVVSTANGGRTLDYNFDAVVGQDYTIRIWAKFGPRVNNNTTGAFAVWSGLSGFETTPIVGTEWSEYVFNVTATSANPMIRIYTSNYASRFTAGNTILVDNVSILPAGAVVDDQSPTAPSNLTANGTTTTSTNLSWNASTDNVGVTEYSILEGGNVIGTTTGATTFNVEGLDQNTSYAFTVTARDAAGNVSAASNTANVTTLTAVDNQAPTAPTNLAATGTTTTTTTLSWTASTDNVGVTEYSILEGGNLVGTTSGANTFNVEGLTQNTSYAFTVTARDAAGNVSAASNTANVTTLEAADNQSPTAPTNLEANGTTTNSTNLTWTASTDNVGVAQYTILQDGNNVGTTDGETIFNVTGLAQNTSYAFTVIARDAAGNVSAASNTANVTTIDGGGEIDYTSANSNLETVDWTARDLFANRNVGIGTTNTQGYRLAVAGSVVAEEVNVKLQVNWPDYVFEKTYNLPSLQEVEDHILEQGYLLNMPSASEVEENGIEIGQMNAKLLRKIEELTLYTIQQEKKIKLLEEENRRIDSLAQKLEKLEEVIKENK